MSEWASHLEHRWFAVALAAKIGRKPVRAMLLNRPIVLARLDGQRVVGFQDRCPHRHAPLSQGSVIDGTLQCPYHGWRFDAQGQLQALPGAPPETCLPGVRARAVSVIEYDGVIWARYAEEGDTDIPARVRALAPDHRKFLWQTTWHAHMVDALENVLDPLHTHFVHAGLVRRKGARQAMHVSLCADAEGFVVDYAGQSVQSGLLYRLFESPRERERASFSAPGTAQLHYHYRNGSRACISLHFSPETAHRSRLIGVLHLEGRRVPAWMVRAFLWPFIRKVAQQDRRMLAMQTDNSRLFADRKDVITRFDVVRRHLLSAWSNAEDAAAAPADSDTVLML
ncbi:MAG TPA: Rieske 2Fe-2S domain-containing protein [Dyella sp.]|uniref:Rieske 2Fe-2S domain-containing protein n=1 Tax=Dyella sp. TaxID=1869338 RepID=UPI002C76F28A|nr:Rieske 2Fe-2S domain-containing protein [Dyella sp.]HUB91703.1 Rieske 2Fe-2S domain-containing protein [Dyella sp.]